MYAKYAFISTAPNALSALFAALARIYYLGMDLLLLALGSSEPAEDQTGRLVGSSFIGGGTLLQQTSVMALNGVFHDGSKSG